MSEQNGQMNELRDTIERYNYAAASLRDKLHSAVPIPFHIDPLLDVVVSFEEPIPLDKHVALELYNKKFMEISSVIIRNQKVIFFFNTEDGEDTNACEVLLYDNISNIFMWEYYLLTLIAHEIVPLINGAREEASAFLSKLMGTIDASKKGEDNE